jgi:zinc protease
MRTLTEINQHGERIRRIADFEYNEALRVEHYQLTNGLELLFIRDSQAPVFSYQTWFRVGSRNEQAGRTGIAHLFEHLMFKETKNTPEGEFDRRLEGVGARVNAATWLDWTYYYEDVPGSEHLAMVVGLEADRMEHMVLNSEQLEAEREVVINERKERVDNDPAGKMSEVLWHLALDGHPYGHPTIGWMQDIEAISLEDCLEFYRTYYSPNNAVVVVVGDVERDALLKTVVDAYGHMPAQSIPDARPVDPPTQDEARRAELELAVSGERLMVGYRAPAITDPAHPALEILNEILFEGDSARLWRALVTDGELAMHASAFVPAFRESGLYEISVDLRPGTSAEAAETVLLAELAKVSADGVTGAELVKARNKLETQFYRQLSTAQQKAGGLGYWAVTTGDFRGLFRSAERYARVTAEDVRRVAAELLRPSLRSTVVVRPLSDDEDAQASE